MQPRVFIPQLVERWDPASQTSIPVFDFTSATVYGALVPILAAEDNIRFLARITDKIRAALANYTEDDYFVAVGDPSVIAICAGLILRRNQRMKLLRWDKKLACYTVLDINV